jgi:hypothetical protein
MIPTLGDYEEWRAVADVLITRAEAELTRFFEEHGAIPEPWYLPVEAVRNRWDGMGGALQQSLTDPQFTWAPAIVSMVDIAKDGACQIGVVEAERIRLGGEPSNIPDPPAIPPGSSSKGGGKGMGLGLVLLLGLAAWGASRD